MNKLTTTKFNIKKILILLFFVEILVFSSCSEDNPTNPNSEPVLISQKLVFRYSTDLLTSFGQMLGVNITPEYPVAMYKITYKSEFMGRTCSGYICIPDTSINSNGVVLVQHPTSFNDSEVQGNYALLACATASLGYVTISNDYIGFGSSIDEVQTYHIANYSANDAISALYATSDFISKNNINTLMDLRLIGYSQGGYNVLALQKELEKRSAENKPKFNLKEVYSGAAPISLTSLLQQVLSQNNYETYYLPQFIISYNQYYLLGLNYSDIFQPEYSNIILNYYNVKNIDEKWRDLPKKVDELLTEKFINETLAGSSMFYEKLRENNLDNFSPKNKLYLYSSENDDVVFHNIILTAYEYYKSHGGNVELVKNPSGKNHKDTHTDFFEFVLRKL